VDHDDAVKVVLDGCTVSHVGGTALEFEGNGATWSPSASDPYGNEFINGVITDVGACGLRVGTTPNKANTETTTAQGVHVANDLITGGGRFLHSGMAVIVGDAHDVVSSTTRSTTGTRPPSRSASPSPRRAPQGSLRPTRPA